MTKKYKHSPETGIWNLADRLYDSRYLYAHHSFEAVAALCEEAGQELLEYINAMHRIRKLQAENARLRVALANIMEAATIESVALRDIAEEALER